MTAGASLRTAGGESFEKAVKDISDKSLSVGEGTYIVYLTEVVCI